MPMLIDLADSYADPMTGPTMFVVLIQGVEVCKVLLVKNKGFQHHTVQAPLLNRVQARIDEVS